LKQKVVSRLPNRRYCTQSGVVW